MTTRKRADRRTGGLLPELERPDGQRYKCRPCPRKWTAAEDLVLVAAVANCRGANAYGQCCVDLLSLFGRVPTYPAGVKPPRRQYVDTCVRYVEVRLITKMIAGYGHWKMPPGFGQFRAAVPELTWGERVKILKPFWRKAFVEDKLPASAGSCDILRMLHRDGPRSHLLASAYFDRLQHGDNPDGVGDPHARSPLSGRTLALVGLAMEELHAHCFFADQPTQRQNTLEDIYGLLGAK